MKKFTVQLLVILLFLMSFSVFAGCEQAKQIDMYLIAGQSNACGYTPHNNQSTKRYENVCYAVNVIDASTLYYGLMDRNGKRITPPIFTSIEAIGMDLYFCKPQGIVINGKGKRVE